MSGSQKMLRPKKDVEHPQWPRNFRSSPLLPWEPNRTAQTSQDVFSGRDPASRRTWILHRGQRGDWRPLPFQQSSSQNKCQSILFHHCSPTAPETIPSKCVCPQQGILSIPVPLMLFCDSSETLPESSNRNDLPSNPHFRLHPSPWSKLPQALENTQKILQPRQPQLPRTDKKA